MTPESERTASGRGRWGRARRRVLIAGAGIAALEALLALRHLAEDRVEIDLIAPTPDFVYRPLAVLEPFGRGEAQHLPLGAIVRDHGAGHAFDAITGVDPDECRVRATSGDRYGYEALVVASGARAVEALPGALTFSGKAGVAGFRELLTELERGEVEDLVFAVPEKTAWALPLYELALVTSAELFERRHAGVRLSILTPERSPLAAFGDRGSAVVAELLEQRGIEVHAGVAPRAVGEATIVLADGRTMPADRVVALPRLLGPALPGLPADSDGFLEVDEHGRVAGVERVWAAGDVTSSPIKQGGLATQQADAVAESLAEWAGAPVRPSPLRPVLRAVLLTGEGPTYLRSDTHHDRQRSLARSKPLWWPPAKVAGRYLSPYLAARGVRLPPEGSHRGIAVQLGDR